MLLKDSPCLFNEAALGGFHFKYTRKQAAVSWAESFLLSWSFVFGILSHQQRWPQDAARNMRHTWGLTSGSLLSFFPLSQCGFPEPECPSLICCNTLGWIALRVKPHLCSKTSPDVNPGLSSCDCFFCSLAFGTLYPAYSSYKAVKTKNVKEYVSMTRHCRLDFHPCHLLFDCLLPQPPLAVFAKEEHN